MIVGDAAESTILVTGATDGLGRRVARELAAKGATVLLHGRSPERLDAALEEVRTHTGSKKLGSYAADLSSLGEVRGLSEQVLSEHDRLDVLVNNAGVTVREREESEDGHELTFSVLVWPHSSSSVASRRSGLRPCSSTVVPFAASSSATRLPRPPVAPVTSIVASAKFLMQLPSGYDFTIYQLHRPF